MTIKKLKLLILIIKLKIQILILRKKLTIPNLPKPRIAILHHGGGDWNFERVNNHHKKKWGFISSLGFGIGYQKFIEFDGTVFTGRRDNEEGAHTIGMNNSSVGICLQGNMEERKPTQAQLISLTKELGKYEVVKMHCDFSKTLCPGKYLKEWLLKGRTL